MSALLSNIGLFLLLPVASCHFTRCFGLLLHKDEEIKRRYPYGPHNGASTDQLKPYSNTNLKLTKWVILNLHSALMFYDVHTSIFIIYYLKKKKNIQKFNYCFFYTEFGTEEEKYGHPTGSGSHIGEQRPDRIGNPPLSLPVLQQAEWRALRRDREWTESLHSQRHRYKRRHRQHNRKHAH